MTFLQLAICSAVLASGGEPPSLETLNEKREAARRHYDMEAAKELIPKYQAIVEQNRTDDNLMELGRAARLAAELMRLEYEKNDELDPRDARLLGRDIDDVARIGHDAMDALPDSSEKFRIKADLWGTMIRSNFKGKLYGDNMEEAMEKAVDLDPENPQALVTRSKIPLFAEEKHLGPRP